MATAVEIYAGDFFRLIKPKPNTKVYDLCNKHFNRTAHYKHLKKNNNS